MSDKLSFSKYLDLLNYDKTVFTGSKFQEKPNDLFFVPGKMLHNL